MTGPRRGRDIDHLPVEQRVTHWDSDKDAKKPWEKMQRQTYEIPDELMTERAMRLWLKFRNWRTFEMPQIEKREEETG